jgi:electron transfer flavoprotein alpha subunit
MKKDCSDPAAALEKKGIIVFAECEAGRIAEVTYEVIQFARILAAEYNEEKITIIIAGRDIRRAAETLARCTGFTVIGAQSALLEPYCAEAYQLALLPILSSLDPRYVCIAHTAIGSDWAPGLATALGASCITSITGISVKDSRLIFTRPAFKGKWNMLIAPLKEQSILTIQPGAFPAFTKEVGNNGNVKILDIKIVPRWTVTGETLLPEEASRDLEEADVIVGAGRGIGKEENLSLIRELAGLYQKSAVGGSRTVCDLGWLPYPSQIGITGKSVAPKLYIACGISGSLQHVTGIKGARFIAAINKDPEAPIFQVADWGIVEDLTTFIPLLLDYYAQMKDGEADKIV